MKKGFLSLAIILVGLGAYAQRWQQYDNALHSLRYHSHNPTRISYNPQRDFAVAQVAYQWGRGDFRAPHMPARHGLLTTDIEGARRIGGFDLQGHIGYQHHTERNQRWNSTLWLTPNNPFVLADSIASDATTEAFDLRATAAYTLAPRWRIGAALGLRTGNRSDQSDPRPRAMTAHLPIVLGVDYAATPQWSVGLAGSMCLRNATIEYYNVRGDNNHSYFLMKGMGDYITRNTGDEPGYKRDYTASTYTASLQSLYVPTQRSWGSFTEIRLYRNLEKATDGGTSYAFRAGDYQALGLALHQRLQWQPRPHTHHTLSLKAHHTSVNAVWYDQRRTIDAARGGAILYHILNKSTLQRQQHTAASLHYRWDNRQCAHFLATDLGFSRQRYEHLLGTSSPVQHISTLHFGLQAGKAFGYRQYTLWTELGGSYHLPLQRSYANGSPYTNANSIEQAYTRPAYAYAASGSAAAYGLIDVYKRLNQRLGLGGYLHAEATLPTMHAPEWSGYKGQSTLTTRLGLYLRF